MNGFDFNYYDGSLFAAGLAVAAIVRFKSARRLMAAASAPLFLSLPLYPLGALIEGARGVLFLLWLFSLVTGMMGFWFAVNCDDAQDRRHAFAATALLASPFLLMVFMMSFGAR